ncbi:DUF3376 domain-containing protein [Pseudarthrobacter sp. NIBRBAC000502772]|uniref:DUF3376 domain-containing protein n=1 Tax=Pseudarthrobacter sp. NIBRBAC000502772 TaxID=2590775 RepID=UPI00143D0471|nr:DUF3376 domain-containing protein [Pseudarthrobacter sp. NIBRBAC000502772]
MDDPWPIDEVEFNKGDNRLMTGPPFGRILRLALAVKGGVSLAVWIGGAIAELDVLRRVRIFSMDGALHGFFVRDLNKNHPDEERSGELLTRAQFYAKWLASRGYDRVEIDVLAGASAGGLNAIFYGAAQRAGASFECVLNTWLTQGSIWKLLRAGGLRSVPSLFQGDAYFWKGVHDELMNLYDSDYQNVAHVADRVVVDLSATITDPEYLSSLPTREGRGHFHFKGSDDPGTAPVDGNDIPRGGETAPDADKLWRLAYAARTTSSFPGAFEPGLIWSHPTAPTSESAAPPGAVDMSFAFNAHRTGVKPFRVVDGGVLDNIPIDRALSAIKSLSSDYYASRLVVYLDPSPELSAFGRAPSERVPPPNPATPHRRRTDNLSYFSRVVTTGIGMRGIRESGTDEVEELQRLRWAKLLEQTRMNAWRTGALQYQVSNASDIRLSYARSRRTSDFDLFYKILRDPARWQLDSILVERHSLSAWEPDLITPLDLTLRKHYRLLEEETSAGRGPLLGGSQALIDAAAAALSWLRDLEESAFAGAGSSYLPDIPGPLTQKSVRQLLHFINISARSLRDQQILDLIKQRMPLDNMVQEWLKAQGSTDIKNLWSELDRCVAALKEYNNEGSVRTPAQWAAFREEFGARDLAPYITPLDRPDPVKAILFEKISASQPSSLDADPKFRSLLAAHRAAVAQGWLRLGDSDFAAAAIKENLPSGLSAEAKLAGSALGNFAAFFSENWRRNDWSWGRIDASAGIIRTLESLPLSTASRGLDESEPLVRRTMSGKEDIAAAQQSVIRQQSIDSLMAGPGDLSRLRPAYLSALTHRVARVGLRAVIGGKSRHTKAASFAIAPLFLTYAPFAFCHLAGIFCASLLATAIAAATPAADHNQEPNAFWISTALSIVVLLTAVSVSLPRVIKGFSRRHTLKQMPSLSEDAEPRLRRSARWSIVYCCSGTASLITSVVILDHEQEFTCRTWIFVLATAWMLLAARRASRTLPITPLRRKADWLWASAAITALAAAAGTAWLPPSTTPPGNDPFLNSSIALGVAGTVISAVLTHGWMTGARKLRTKKGTIAWLCLSGLTGAITIGSLTLIGLTDVGATAAVTSLDLAATWVITSHFIWWTGSWDRLASYEDADDNPWQTAA